MARGGRERKKFFYEIGSYAAFNLNCDLAIDTGSHYLPDAQQRVG